MKKINNNIKINYEYTIINDEPIIRFKWGDSTREIFIEKEGDLDLNDLYDFIIDNIKEVIFKDITDPIYNDKKETVNYMSFEAVILAIQDEFSIIKKEYEDTLCVNEENNNEK